ncbi:toprim domain-containing protein [Gelidibacter mesophilus]|uniref:toprim domain-containing protein n=1 Tax=Gelidibacter mesophilus TaxID=169050 RepID=UPI0004032029|nr:toprim domain-containing protein [Gelidibacter mesophilus]
MNCKEAKNIDIDSYLKRHGQKPDKNYGNYSMYFSPLRNETTASLKVDRIKNLWMDFGAEKGGTIIDLVMYLNNCSIEEALKILSNDIFLFHQPPKIAMKEKNYSIDKVTEIENSNLLRYLDKRKLNHDFVKQFCSQVHYTFSNRKTAYGIGFRNDLGGFEIRNEGYQGCLGKKSITSILNNSKTASLFESWSDFMAYLSLKNRIPEEDFIILNSTSLVKHTKKLLKNYTILKVLFDNDDSARRALNFVQENAEGRVIDCSVHYSDYNDLNEFLINYKITKSKVKPSD